MRNFEPPELNVPIRNRPLLSKRAASVLLLLKTSASVDAMKAAVEAVNVAVMAFDVE